MIWGMPIWSKVVITLFIFQGSLIKILSPKSQSNYIFTKNIIITTRILHHRMLFRQETLHLFMANMGMLCYLNKQGSTSFVMSIPVSTLQCLTVLPGTTARIGHSFVVGCICCPSHFAKLPIQY